ncbi:MAG: NAD(P)H-dependent oxidoreductase [Thermoanaerobaculia bacterium]
MGDKVKVVGLGGSLGAPSRSLAASKIALEGAEQAGATTRLFDIRAMNLPIYAPGAEDVPDAVRLWCAAAHDADGMLWSSPLYHGTISGSFKNALDWLQLLADREPPYLMDKVIGLISAAGGTHGLQAVNTMEFSVRALRGWAVPLVIPIPEAWRVIDAQGRASDAQVAQQLRTLGQEVARVAGHFARGATTTPEAARAEAAQQPISEDEVARAAEKR